MSLPLLTPSVARRTLVTLSLAALLVIVVLLVYDFLEFKAKTLPAVDEQMQLIGSSIASSLADVHDKQQVQVAVASIAKLIADIDKKSGIVGLKTYFVVRDTHHKLIYAYPQPLELQPPASGAAFWQQTIDGKPFHIYQSSQGAWTIWLARYDLHYSSFIVDNLKQLVFNVLLALPFLIIPVWWAVSQGLRPLTALSEHIERRDPNDLAPIKMDIPQAELKPIIYAINGLLDRLRKKLAQEKAFIHDAAHELQTPLANVLAQSHVLMRETDDVQKDLAMQHLEHSITRASHLIRQLLQLDRLEALVTDDCKEVDVTRLVRESLMLHSREAAKKNIELTLHAADKLVIKTVPHALLSIIDNLIGNALRYIPEHSHIEVMLESNGQFFILRVKDDGPGIAEAEREMVFNRFYRGRNETCSGSGLGLAIVKQAAEALHGTVELGQGLHGRGCGFEVRLPA